MYPRNPNTSSAPAVTAIAICVRVNPILRESLSGWQITARLPSEAARVHVRVGKLYPTRFVIPSRSQPRNARRERARNLLHGSVPARKRKRARLAPCPQSKIEATLSYLPILPSPARPRHRAEPAPRHLPSPSWPRQL